MVKKRSKLIFSFKNKTFFKFVLWHFLSKKSKITNDENGQNQTAKFVFNYKYNCRNPKSFNEYLGWLKFNYTNELWKKCADKLGSKLFLEEIGLEKYIVKTLGVYNSSSEIDLDILPNDFVLKANHDCGSVYICHKGITNFKEVFLKLDNSLNNRYSNKNGEWVYSDIKPCIFAEELLHTNDSELKDYKIQTIGGKYIFGYVLSNKAVDERHELFEDDFKMQNCLYQSLSTNKKHKTPKPEVFDEMIKIAEEVGKHFLEVRVDFYITSTGLKIGELTFFTQSGFGQFSKKKYDLKYGTEFEKMYLLDKLL